MVHLEVGKGLERPAGKQTSARCLIKIKEGLMILFVKPMRCGRTDILLPDLLLGFLTKNTQEP
jgi:hypothetical protein